MGRGRLPMAASDQERTEAKRLRNKRAHAASQLVCDHVLLRLDKGGAATLDAAGAEAGLSRSAFARLYLEPLVSALAPNLHAIDEASRARGQSLAQFLASAIERALLPAPEQAADALPAAADFDRLFATED